MSLWSQLGFRASPVLELVHDVDVRVGGVLAESPKGCLDLTHLRALRWSWVTADTGAAQHEKLKRRLKENQAASRFCISSTGK